MNFFNSILCLITGLFIYMIPLHAQFNYPTQLLKAPDFRRHFTPTASVGVNDGALIVVGYYTKFNEDVTATSEIPFACKFNATGGLVWFYDYYHNGAEYPNLDMKPKVVKTTYSHDGIIIGGNVYEAGNYLKPFVIKLDGDGYEEFTRFYSCMEDREDEFLIPCYSMYLNDLIVDPQGEIIIAGKAQYYEEGSHFGYVLRLDQHGNEMASHFKIFTHPQYNSIEALGVKFIGDSDFAVLLNSTQPVTTNAWEQRTNLVRMNDSFQTIWAKDIYRDYYYDCYTPTDFEVSSDQNIIILGEFQEKLCLSLVTSSGNEWWTKAYSYNNLPGEGWLHRNSKLARDFLDNLYIAHRSGIGVHGQGLPITSVMKVSPIGNHIWSRQLNGTNNSESTQFNEFAIADNPPLTVPAQYISLVGKHSILQGVGLSESAWKARVATDNGDNDCYSEEVSCEETSLSFSSANVDLGFFFVLPLGTDEILGNGDPAMEINNCPGFIFIPNNSTPDDPINLEQQLESAFSVYPNPNDGVFTVKIHSAYPKQGAQISLYHLTGELIVQKRITSEQEKIDVHELSKGVYLLKCEQGNENTVRRVVIQ